MSLHLRTATAMLLAGLGLLTAAAKGDPPTPSQVEFFEKEVRPLLVERCGECHGDRGKPKGGLRLTSRAAVLEGGDSGPAAVAGKPAESLIVEAIRYIDEPRMPPKAKLADREIATLTRWVAQGLPWPDAPVVAPAATAGAASDRITDEQRAFWSFRPVRDVPPPPVKDAAWPRSDLDRFVLAPLEGKGLKPAPPADKRTLIRRATFDLTGLPPSPEEVEAFLADSAPDAFARLVDRLLASPHYGERWGRHWLDVVRYADSFDSRGIGGDGDIAYAWRYRDWVVDAFNRDLPYDQFIIHQLAGDLLPPREPGGVNAEGTIATGLLAIGNWGGGDADKEKLLTDIADDQVDVVGRAFLGLTIACARCHDHKFDPIPTRDYYGLAGIFFSTHILPNVGAKTAGPPMLRIPLVSKPEMERRSRHAGRVAELEKRLRETLTDEKKKFAQAMLDETARYLVASWEYLGRTEAESSSLEEFAAKRGLHAFALRRWIDELGLSGEFALMPVSLRDMGGRAGVHAWRGAEDCPSLTVNVNAAPVTHLTFTLPARSVSVHPGPAAGVAVSWKSPLDGKVRLSGRLADADPVGGDGIAWVLEHRSAREVRTLAEGAIPNGGAAAIEAPALAEVEIRVGDRIGLLVLPKNGHGFDTTTVALTVAEQGGPGTWDLTRDLVDAPLQGNPHADRLGHADVWRFEDRAARPASTALSQLGDALAQWRSAISTRPADRKAVEDAARAIQGRFHRTDKRSPFWIASEADEAALPEAARTRIAELRKKYRALKQNPPPPVEYANGAQDGGVPDSPQVGVHDVRVHVRGSYSRLGPVVPRHFPRILAGDSQPPIASGSGRLELARWLASPDHVLTARVMVNRVWQHHFGAGIVRTPNNFGKLGERPTHPELLDHLARRFVAGGWSLKRLHRMIMLSAAYRQSSEADPETAKADPDNRLFGRMNRRRLESEEVRDSLLSVSGRLDRTPGGPAARDFQDPRRTLYQMTVRSDRSTFGPLFDAADSTAMVDTRTVSTVAPQALFLLNNPFVLRQSQALARRLLALGGDDGARIDAAYALLFGRPPSVEERAIGLVSVAGDGTPEARWGAYCQVLLCTNEFIYID